MREICLHVAALAVALSGAIPGPCRAQTLTADSLDTSTVAQVAPLKDRNALGDFLTPSDTFDRRRFGRSLALAGTLYAATATGLWFAWYDDFETGPFQLIDDRREWEYMDKLGHGYTAYHYTRWSNQGLRWSGTRRPLRLALAGGMGILLQSTVEVMDGYSVAWGFSWADMAYNTAGTSLFIGQELAFREQRIRPKFSAFRQNHSRQPVPATHADAPVRSLADRAEMLYGDGPWSRFLKDYNGQTVWLSTNPAVLAGFGESAPLPWLNLSVGYSPRNVYGAYTNTWGQDGAVYLGDDIATREREWILSLDIDFERIPARRPAVRTLLHLLNHMKFPAPALILNDARSPSWRWLYY